jgi:hypothetical protein
MQNRDLDRHYAAPNSNLTQLVQLAQLRDNFQQTPRFLFREGTLCPLFFTGAKSFCYVLQA